MTEVLRAARTLQEALAAVGPWWELTASASTESDVVRASIAINPHYVPHAEGYKISIEPNLLSIVAADEPGCVLRRGDDATNSRAVRRNGEASLPSY